MSSESSSATLPPYSTLPSDIPPPYSPGSEVQQDGERSHTQAVVDYDGYAPTPASLNQSHTADVEPFEISALPRIADHYILTIIMMVLCGVMLNVFAFSCLLPALSFSKKSTSARQRGEYVEARSKAQWALWLNVAALISYLALMMLGIAIVVVVLLQ